jgi:hypothetical protein
LNVDRKHHGALIGPGGKFSNLVNGKENS